MRITLRCIEYKRATPQPLSNTKIAIKPTVQQSVCVFCICSVFLYDMYVLWNWKHFLNLCLATCTSVFLSLKHSACVMLQEMFSLFICVSSICLWFIKLQWAELSWLSVQQPHSWVGSCTVARFDLFYLTTPNVMWHWSVNVLECIAFTTGKGKIFFL